MIDSVKKTLKRRLQENPQGYLKNSYENLLYYFSNTPWEKNISLFLKVTQTQDNRRNINSRKVFTKLYKELDANTLE
jgi:hypothetical protein